MSNRLTVTVDDYVSWLREKKRRRLALRRRLNLSVFFIFIFLAFGLTTAIFKTSALSQDRH